MKAKDIQKLASEGLYLGRKVNGQVLETHISWLIISQKWVFKIKKPVKLSFLDYSTLESRAHFCEKEIQLNGRFSSIYIRRLSGLPGMKEVGYWMAKKGTVYDYAVLMKRYPGRISNG